MITAIEYALMAGRAYLSNRKNINWFPIPDDLFLWKIRFKLYSVLANRTLTRDDHHIAGR